MRMVARGSRIEPELRISFCVFVTFSRKLLRYKALGTGCTLTAVSRSTQPSAFQVGVSIYSGARHRHIPYEKPVRTPRISVIPSGTFSARTTKARWFLIMIMIMIISNVWTDEQRNGYKWMDTDRFRALISIKHTFPSQMGRRTAENCHRKTSEW